MVPGCQAGRDAELGNALRARLGQETRRGDVSGCLWLRMYIDAAVRAHHVQHWGADFQWDDFLPLFKAEKYDPEALVKLLKEAGARYLITMSKHHDGVAWWDSQWTKRNFVQMGPKKDLLTPLMAAAKKRDIKVVMYFCYEEWATAVLGEDDKPCYPHLELGHLRGPASADRREPAAGLGQHPGQELLRPVHDAAGQGDDRPLRSRRPLDGWRMGHAGRNAPEPRAGGLLLQPERRDARRST